MSRSAYYLAMRDLAHQKRSAYDVTTERLDLNSTTRSPGMVRGFGVLSVEKRYPTFRMMR